MGITILSMLLVIFLFHKIIYKYFFNKRNDKDIIFEEGKILTLKSIKTKDLDNIISEGNKINYDDFKIFFNDLDENVKNLTINIDDKIHKSAKRNLENIKEIQLKILERKNKEILNQNDNESQKYKNSILFEDENIVKKDCLNQNFSYKIQNQLEPIELEFEKDLSSI